MTTSGGVVKNDTTPSFSVAHRSTSRLALEHNEGMED